MSLVGKGNMVALPWLNLRALWPAVTNKYYRYQGSLTTPTCNEVVTWTVFALPSYISSAQVGPSISRILQR